TIGSWLFVETDQFSDELPKSFMDWLPLRPFVEKGRIDLMRVIDQAGESDFGNPAVSRVAQLPLPAACRDADPYVGETMSPAHWVLSCNFWLEENDERPRERTLFVIDVGARRLQPIKPPRSDQSGLSRDLREQDAVSVTVTADG